MTVPVPDYLEYVSDANGVTKDFPYPKRFMQIDEVVVFLRDDKGIETRQILNTHYTIAGSSWPNGGTVSFVAAPQAPNKVVRYRMTQAKQTVGLANNQKNDAPSVELQLDRLTMGNQDTRKLADRSLKFPAGSAGTNVQPLPLPERGKALVGNKDSTGYINAPVGEGDIAVAVIEATEARDEAVGAKNTAVQSDANARASALTAYSDAIIANNAKNAAVAAATSLHNYDTLAQANANIGSIPNDAGVNILADGENNGFYVKEGGVLVRKSTATVPSLQTVTNRLARATDVLDPSQEFAHILQDKDGFFNAYFKANGAMRNVSNEQDILGLRIVQDDNDNLSITDELGFVILMVDENGVDFVGKGGGVPDDDQITLEDCMPFISSNICGMSGDRLRLFTSGMLADRTKSPYAQISILGASGETATSMDEISLPFDGLGSTGEIILRPRSWNGSARLVQKISLSVAPVPAISASQVSILPVGDSTINRQGPFLLNQTLASAGYLPDFIGTMRSSSSPTSTTDISGPLAEGREGWETGDYTNAVTDRSFPINPGDEAAYLAMPKIQQRDYNPFIRVATGSDDVSLVRNGYILDFGFYQTRFSLNTPGIVVINLGTNDIRDRASSVVGDAVYDNVLLLITRMLAAWPNANIIVTMPGTSRDATRDAIWTDKYIPVIKALLRVVRDYKAAHPLAKITLAPVWAMVNQDGGYSLTTSATDPITGVTTSTPDDPIHPIDGNRAALYRALSGYVACAMAGLI